MNNMSVAGRRIFQSIVIAYLVIFLFPFKGHSQTREKMEKEIGKIIKLEPSIHLENIPGYIIGVIKQDSTYIFGYGNTGTPQKTVPTRNTAFEIGGLSKVFTASLVEILVSEGQLHMDSSLNHYLPMIYQNREMGHVKLIDLLSHASGLPKMPTEFGAHEKEPNNPYAHYSKKDLLQFYKNFEPSPGLAKYNYSHVNFALLEVIIEQKLQRSFETVLREKLLNPLQLNQTFITASDTTLVAQGHSIGGQKSQPWRFSSFAGSEGIKSSMEDLLHFAKLNLSPTAHLLSPILQKTHEKRTMTDYSNRAFAAKGWHVLEKKRFYDTIIHTGNTSGFRSFFAFIPESQTAVIVLSNSEMATGGLGYLIMRMINANFNKRKVKRVN